MEAHSAIGQIDESGTRSDMDDRAVYVAEGLSGDLQADRGGDVERIGGGNYVGAARYGKRFRNGEKNVPFVFFVENVRKRAVDLITQAYSSIHIDTVAAMTGLTPEQTKEACVEKEWSIEPDTLMVHPKAPPKPPPCHTSSEDQLNKLTNFVSFLEN